MSRIEFIAGLRWARETAEALGLLANREQGIAPVIDVLKRGLVEKPAAYSAGVQYFINGLQEAASRLAARGKA